MKKYLLSLVAGFACAVSAYAVPAAPGFATVKQPDGSTVTLRLIGDEFLNYHTTVDGYTVMRNSEGFYVYAQPSGDSLVATSVIAHDAATRSPQEVKLLESLPKRLVAESALQKAKSARREFKSAMGSTSGSSSLKAAEYDYENFRVHRPYVEVGFQRYPAGWE